MPHLFVTDDGSHSLRSERFGDQAYHSTHGAIQESRHVFIEAGLLPLLTPLPERITILEMGFGTGLNALLVRQHALEYTSTDFDYYTYERYPISLDQATKLNYPEQLDVDRELFDGLHSAEWDRPQSLDPNFTLHKLTADFQSGPTTGPRADVLFYDAFAPECQPELWTEAAMRHCARLLRPGGILVTYCAKGQFKRNLRAAGFAVQALPGPPGKREMTRAVLSSRPV